VTGLAGYDTATRPAFAPAAPPAADAEPRPAPRRETLRRLLERFALIAFALYHLPLFLNNYPSLGGGGFNDDGLAPRWGHVFTPPGIWVARHVFHLAGAMPRGMQGDNGDVAEEFGRLLLCVVIGLAGALVWTFADRRKPRAAWVPETLRVLLRYSIALGLISYGVAKILPMQFPPLREGVLGRRVGDLSPMALLWTFMEYSRPYAFFGGLMECVAVALLCVRRTATLGALVCLAVMTNVALLNYAYDVPVKLYSTMIVVSAAVLVLYDVRRLTAVLVMEHTVPAPTNRSIFHERIPAGGRWAIKLVLVGSVTLSSVVAMRSAMGQMRAMPGVPSDSSAYRLLRNRFHLITE
jgi:membrane protease YdiL (CAAX protease family)